MKQRYLEAAAWDDLQHKMVFVAGARQVGKTTMAKRILERADNGLYLNWDNRDHRREIQDPSWPAEPAVIVLDQIHKWDGWKQWIKGEFDEHGDRLRFLVTGSARMDVYRRGGDSLQGRYHHYRLHPFSLAELEAGGDPRFGTEPLHELSFEGEGHQKVVDSLFRFGGFPEPSLAHSARTHRRWLRARFDRFVREDVRDLESVRDLSQVQILADLLPDRVGSLLSLNSLREDLEVSHRAITSWMDILERLYFVFRISPFTSKRVRSLKQMQKAYLWDWSAVEDPGARFENMIASHLLKMCHYIEDTEGYRVDLHYLRDRAGREADFLVAVDGRPWFAVEAKLSESRVERSVQYFKDRLHIPWVYQVALEAERDVIKDGVRLMPARTFLAGLV